MNMIKGKNSASVTDKPHRYIGNTYLLRLRKIRRILQPILNFAARCVAALLAILSAFLILGSAGASDTESIGCGMALAMSLLGTVLLGATALVLRISDRDKQ